MVRFHQTNTSDEGHMFHCAGIIAGVITGLLAFSFFGLACVASFAATSAGIGACHPLSRSIPFFAAASYCKDLHRYVMHQAIVQ